jgi:hypothetical protein
MSNWCVVFLLIGLAGSAACREATVSPPREPAPSAAPAPPPAPATVDTQPSPATVTDKPNPKPPRTTAPAPVRSFAVYALSRGTGVPPEARAALRQIVELAEEDQRRGVKVTITTTRIGIEGETRACIAYEDPKEGSRAYERARVIVKDVDLVNLKVEPCGTNEEKES